MTLVESVLFAKTVKLDPSIPNPHEFKFVHILDYVRNQPEEWTSRPKKHSINLFISVGSNGYYYQTVPLFNAIYNQTVVMNQL